jgi:hypothetical protein
MSATTGWGHLPSFSAGASGRFGSATTVLEALNERQLLALSITACPQTGFPELRADRPYNQPGDDGRP